MKRGDMKRSILCVSLICGGCALPTGPVAHYPYSVTPNAYGPGVGMAATGQPVTLRPTYGAGGDYSNSQVQKIDAYGPGIHMDQYGRPVSYGGGW